MKALILTETGWDEYVDFCKDLGIVGSGESHEGFKWKDRMVIYTPKKAEDI
jgi:hypothetical protein